MKEFDDKMITLDKEKCQTELDKLKHSLIRKAKDTALQSI
jgi:hypothetical protein